MSEQREVPIKRYACVDTFCGSEHDPDECGEWVKHVDHIAVLAERDKQIAELSAELAALQQAWASKVGDGTDKITPGEIVSLIEDYQDQCRFASLTKRYNALMVMYNEAQADNARLLAQVQMFGASVKDGSYDAETEQAIVQSRRMVMALIPGSKCACPPYQTCHNHDCSVALEARARMEGEYRDKRAAARKERP